MSDAENKKTLKQGLEAASAFFSPENLAKLKITFNGDVALMVIDVQKQFCDPQTNYKRGSFETNLIATNIQDASTAFRKASIPVYAVHFGTKAKTAAEVDFHHFAPTPKDTLISKITNSAFEGPNNQTNKTLSDDGRKLLLMCGFNLSACVMTTAIDAVTYGYDVCVLEDLTGNDGSNRHCNKAIDIQIMKDSGVTFASSAEALRAIMAAKAPKP